MSDAQYVTFEKIIKDILLLHNVMLSVRSHGAVAELRIDRTTPFRINQQYATIGDEKGQWHIHVNIVETKEAKFVTEGKENGRKSYSLRFFNSNDELIMRVNFLNMYNPENVLMWESLYQYEKFYSKYGQKETLQLTKR
ncbi:MAG TPA: ChuX/HutX family heme-like substrate-binding protein [Candidatus Nitrosocosmicus sp.]|nr:ChuX/HutX family heme-like substrate-binding protein [Candidatus Nitrosocosmicus sp.]